MNFNYRNKADLENIRYRTILAERTISDYLKNKKEVAAVIVASQNLRDVNIKLLNNTRKSEKIRC